MAQLKVAIIGQSPFAAEVYKLLRQNGHQITGVFTIPDKGNREDPLGSYRNLLTVWLLNNPGSSEATRLI